jgi:hypothetical protein
MVIRQSTNPQQRDVQRGGFVAQRNLLRVKRTIELPAKLWVELEQCAGSPGLKAINRLLEKVCGDFVAAEQKKKAPKAGEKNWKLDLD